METTENNRYLIYELLHREVRWEEDSFKGNKFVSGVVTKVTRDIFDGKIEITVDSRRYSFDEPTVIYKREGELVFAYGGVGHEDFSDEELFNEVRESYGDSLNDVLKRTRPDSVKMKRFTMGEKVVEEKRNWERRV